MKRLLSDKIIKTAAMSSGQHQTALKTPGAVLLLASFGSQIP